MDAVPAIKLERIRIQPCPLPARSLAFTEDGAFLLSLTCEGAVQVFDVTEDQPTLKATLQSPSGRDKIVAHHDKNNHHLVNFIMSC